MNKFNSNLLEKTLKELNHDATLIMAECNAYFLNKAAIDPVDLDVDSILKQVRCDRSCCNPQLANFV